MSVIKVGSTQAEELVVYAIHSDLTHGSLNSAREKFARAGQESALLQLVNELDPNVPGRKLNLGNWREGGIEITGLETIVANKHSMLVVNKVLFPPKEGQTEPSSGTYQSFRWNAGVASGVAVLALTRDGRIVVIREYKHPIRAWATHIMRGFRHILRGGIVESLRTCGLREAGEEAGVKTTADSEVYDLGTFYPDSGALQSKPRLIMVTNVDVAEARNDVTEAISGTYVLTPQEFAAMLCKPTLLKLEDADPVDEDAPMADSFTEAAFWRAVNAGFIKL